MKKKGPNKEGIETVTKLEEIEYGTKELIHGLVMGVVIGFILAMIFFR